MCRSHVSRLFASLVVAGVAVVWSFAPLGPAAPPKEKASERSVYDADPEHLWNRLHEALFIRVGPDGRTYGQDRLEPLLWAHSKHLLEERSHKRAAAVLEEFLKDKGEKRIDDPLKRALLQRDLWLVFNWLEGDHDDFKEPALKPEEARTAKERLRRPLAAIIDRLALTSDQLKKLPDNYAAAVASGKFPKKYNTEHPDQPYLPSDLFEADGPWVCVGRTDGITAPEHLHEGRDHRFNNSVFLVFLRLPAGRAATVGYLKRLRSFGPTDPKLPQLPEGTRFALVRRALLIDTSHRVVPTPLTESVQLRVDRKSFHEFRLSRSALFAGRAGGLHPLGPDEGDFKTGFDAHPMDEFELRQGEDSFRSRQFPVRGTCIACHGERFPDFRAGIAQEGDQLHPFPVSEMPNSKVAGAAVKWKEGQPSWTALRKLLAE
jgi:hypothetical protein